MLRIGTEELLFLYWTKLLMKFKAVCPVCKRVVIDDCLACFKNKSLVCDHGTGEMDVVTNVKWEKIEE